MLRFTNIHLYNRLINTPFYEPIRIFFGSWVGYGKFTEIIFHFIRCIAFDKNVYTKQYHLKENLRS